MQFTDEQNIYLDYLTKISENIAPMIIVDISILLYEKDDKKKEKLKQEINDYLDPLLKAMINTYNFKVVPLELVYQLLKIKDYNIENINKLLEKTDIENYLNTVYAKKIFKKIDDNNPIDKSFIDYFTYAISNKKIDPEVAITYTNKIFAEHIKNPENSKNNNVTEELLKNCIILLTEHYMKKYVPNPKTEIIEYNSNDYSKFHLDTDYLPIGSAIYKSEKIELNSILVSIFYLTGNTEIFETMFHELIHIKQSHTIYEKKSINSFEEYVNLKDHIIQGYLDEYYNENYFNISFEQDAKIKSYILTESYLNSLGIVCENIGEIKERINKLIKTYSDDLRKINGKDDDINNVFDNIIQNTPSLLNQYPQLEIEWVLDSNNTVRKKTIEELDDEINGINQILPSLNKDKKKTLELNRKLKLLTILRENQEDISKGRKK